MPSVGYDFQTLMVVLFIGFIIISIVLILLGILFHKPIATTKLRSESALAIAFILGIVFGGWIKPNVTNLDQLDIWSVLWISLVGLLFFVLSYIIQWFMNLLVAKDLGKFVIQAQIHLKNPQDYTFQYVTNEIDPYNPLYTNINRLLDRFSMILAELMNASNLVKESSEIIYKNSEEVSKSSQSISEVMEQISQGTQAQVAETREALNGIQTLKNTQEEGFEKIKEAIDIINEISEETNLLALNAAIEAERAGEYGLGFSVVAQKVRELADQSKIYAERIEELLHGIVSNTEHARVSLEERIKHIDEISENTAAGAEEVSAATEEQSATLEELVSSTRELSRLAYTLQSTIEKLE